MDAVTHDFPLSLIWEDCYTSLQSQTNMQIPIGKKEEVTPMLTEAPLYPQWETGMNGDAKALVLLR